MKVIDIDLEKIEQNDNSRVIYKASDLSELMHSMKKDGQLQPVGVRPLPGGKYDAVFGNRRIIAAKKLGWSSIAANILDGVEEDKDRDILNMLENLKRQNTTVAEDGRMFCVLRDYGLSIDEIAARLDINKVRIETAIDVYRVVPKEYHAQIVNRTTGKKIAGKISASAAHAIMGVRKKNGLNRKQTRALLDFAREDDSSLEHIHKIAPLMKSGLSLKEAISTAGNLTRVVLAVFLSDKCVSKLEKKHGKSINELLIAQIKKNPEFELHENPRPGVRYEVQTRKHRDGSRVRAV